MTSSQQDTPSCQWFSGLASALDRSSAPRLAWLFIGAILARGRRTVTSWIRAAGLGRAYRRSYTTVAAAGKKADDVAARSVNAVVAPLVADQKRITLALDDTPTERDGPRVQGAGIHHNPTPGPAGSVHVYGHIFVVLGRLAVHPAWGVIALPLLARMYVRAVDLPGIDPKHRPEFRTKLEMGFELLERAEFWLGSPGQSAVGGGRRGQRRGPVPQAGHGAGDDGGQPAAQGRGVADGAGDPGAGAARPTWVQGENRIDLAKRAGKRRGWATDWFNLYGKRSKKRYKAFVATWRPVGGAIRVVLVDEPSGQVAFFCADGEATIREILAAVADRFSLETAFRDCKEIVRAGQQQVRFVWANIGAFHFCLWTFTMTEAWAWGRERGELVDRSESPWDDPLRRPSHADKRRARRRELLAEEIRAVLRPDVTEEEIRAIAERLLALAA